MRALFPALGDLSKARILISNDDGIHAPGIKILERVARTLSDDVWVVAPDAEQSAASHSLTLRRPLRIKQMDDRHFAVDGTPTDSVLLAINHVLKDRKPDLMFSGINCGANMGDDVTYSGTIAAAMESTILGVPSIAFSQSYSGLDTVKWETAEHWLAQVVRGLVAKNWHQDTMMNVNFPDVYPGKVRGIELVRQGKRKIGDDLTYGTDPRGEPYLWIGAVRSWQEQSATGTDVSALSQGAVTVTPLRLDLTDYEDFDRLADTFG